MREAFELNRFEYFYKKELAHTMLTLYDITKDKRLLLKAADFCRKSSKHAWEKYSPYVCLALVYVRAGNKKKALENLIEAKKYIPYNKKLEVLFKAVR